MEPYSGDPSLYIFSIVRKLPGVEGLHPAFHEPGGFERRSIHAQPGL
jgi:hypothetical protein